jgi:hypothetical protein
MDIRKNTGPPWPEGEAASLESERRPQARAAPSEIGRSSNSNRGAYSGPTSRPQALRPAAQDVARGAAWLAPRPPAPRTRLKSWRPLRRNSLRGFASIALPFGLHIDDVAIHVAGGRAWASLPAKPQLDSDGRALRDHRGKVQYATILRWRDRGLADRFSEVVVAIVRESHPEALDP